MKHQYSHSVFDGRLKRVICLAIADAIYSYSVFVGVAILYKILFPSINYQYSKYFVMWELPVLIIIINALSRLYHGSMFFPGFPINKVEEIRRLAFSATFSYLIIYAMLLLSQTSSQFSRIVLIISWLITLLFFPIARFSTRYLLKKINIAKSNILIAGAGHTGVRIANEITKSCYYGFNVIGFLDDRWQTTSSFSSYNHTIIGKLAEAAKIAKAYNIDYIICCLPLTSFDETIRSYIKSFKYVMFVPTNEVLPVASLHPISIGFLCGFEFKNQLKYIVPRISKYLLETIIATLAIIVLSPLLLLLAFIVKISSDGPVFYVANRLGQDGQEIKVLKFRTMYKDADTRLNSLLRENPDLKKEWDESFKLKNDPRITRIGDFMRKTSLDELPQFINVLTGTMSIIGPRPIVKAEIPYYGENYEYFKQVKPGISGLWQVSGRSDTDYDQRVALDVYYAMNWSIWLDYYIFFKTVLVVFQRKGAC